MPKLYKKIVLTGASGSLGHELRRPIKAMCDELLSLDIAPLRSEAMAGETYVAADVADLNACLAALEGADAVVHFAAIPDERPFETLLGPNFIGAYNIWEAAYQKGVRRIVYSSSNHAIGMTPKDDQPGIAAAHRPDTFYGLSKCFTEDLARMYWEKRGIESVLLRIASCTKEPMNARALGTWLSFPDLIHLVERALDTPAAAFSIIYGVSNNDRSPFDNSAAGFLGYRPKDNAEDWAEAILANAPAADAHDLAHLRIGGPFASVPLGESGVAGIKASAAKSVDGQG